MKPGQEALSGNEVIYLFTICFAISIPYSHFPTGSIKLFLHHTYPLILCTLQITLLKHVYKEMFHSQEQKHPPYT